MSRGFRKASGGGARIRLAEDEAAVVVTLMRQLLELIGDEEKTPEEAPGMPQLGIAENVAKPDDPVLARLLPDAYRDDPEAAGEFRRYTQEGLRSGKRQAAEVVISTAGTGGEVVLDAEQAQAWLRALNDVRLALGTRLNITEDSYKVMEDLEWDDARYPSFAAYDWLTFLQETLVRSL